MNLIIGIAVILVGLICWIGQVLAFFAPAVATKLGVCEAEGERLVKYMHSRSGQVF